MTGTIDHVAEAATAVERLSRTEDGEPHTQESKGLRWKGWRLNLPLPRVRGAEAPERLAFQPGVGRLGHGPDRVARQWSGAPYCQTLVGPSMCAQQRAVPAQRAPVRLSSFADMRSAQKSNARSTSAQVSDAGISRRR